MRKSSFMRQIKHPGPVTEPQIQALQTRILTVTEMLPAGVTLLEGFTGLLRKHGCQSAVAQVDPTGLWPVAYVLPALSRSAEHAVYYSDRHVPDAPIELKLATVTVGKREEDLWLHCHASWVAIDGSLHCGHLLPDQTFLARPAQVKLSLLFDAGFVVCSDEHTRFSLFKPRILSSPAEVTLPDASRLETGWCLRIAPNIDLSHALERFCDNQNIPNARIRGGVGSTIGAVFDDGRVVEPFVTELLVETGCIKQAGGKSLAQLDIAMIDYTGGVHRGRLARGLNPVLVTCELVLASDPD